MYPHVIRLRGPWELQPLARVGEDRAALPPGRRVELPCRWGADGLAGYAGLARFVRRFGAPARLDPHEHLWLVFTAAEGSTEVWLNGCPTAGWLPGTFDITTVLKPRNELAVKVDLGAPTGGMLGEVFLEVRGPAWLHNVRAVWAGREDPCLCVFGDVKGTSTGPLELYVRCGGRNLIYGTVRPQPFGQIFEFVSERLDEPPAPGTPIQVELVEAAVVWYVVEIPCPPPRR